MSLGPHQDGFGRAMLDHLERGPVSGVLERDDGYVEPHPMQPYFNGPELWPQGFRDALDILSGRVLDVGCGAGRCALYLQDTGRDVVGIDISPGAVEVSRRRGVRDARVLPLSRIGRDLATFDAVLLAGNNLALAGTPAGLVRLLRRLARVTTPTAVVLADGIDPYRTTEPEHLAYHERNTSRGKPAGQIRIRARYRTSSTPWFDLLLRSRAELEENVAGSGWRVRSWLSEGPSSWRDASDQLDPAWTVLLEREP